MAVTLSSAITYKRLVAAGRDEFWYEDIDVAAGTMVELVAATDSIDTTDQLIMFEAYQKVFIINGAKLKVADFVNTRLVHGALGTAHAHGDILTQDQTGDNIAYMVVDFTNTAKTATYGYNYFAGTATAFNTTIAITGSGSGTGFTPTDVDDLVNARLTHVALGTAHASGDTLTQAGSGAIMVADHTNAAKTLTYGSITSGTFDDAGEVTGDGTGSAFTPTAIRLPLPQWYDYTKYPGGTSGPPDSAYLGCLYRGRIVLGGDPEHPFQWYMSRQGNPWDFDWAANDAGTPVRGGSSDAGELGDILRCLIPYKDDYLIFGCATSIWFAVGDPAEGGGMFELDLTTGIFGANSWCWDGAGNLFFWGTNGLYKTTVPGTPVCISAITLPDLIKDEDADPSTHRITMAYDRKDYGLNICITTLADGVNSNYWYDLKTEGFFPEKYPGQCGAYSLFYYAANDPAYRDMLVGCKDGYIRKFDKTAEDDDIGATNEAIDSYAVLGPMQLSSGINDGIISNINIITAYDAGGGALESDDVDYSIYAARSSEKVIEDTVAGTSKLSGTFVSPGLQKGNIDRRIVRGRFSAVKVGNNTETETWGFEKLTFNAKQIGRII